MLMSAPSAARRYIVDDLYTFPDDGNRYEIVHGELLVTPAPRSDHQLVVMEIATALHVYLDGVGRPARVLAGPADIIYDQETWVQPDILVVPAHEVSHDWRTFRNLLLVAEVVSPSSARGDRLVKRREYQERGVGTYWVVDADARVVEEWHPGDDVPALVTDTLRWRAAPEVPGLVLPLGAVWAALPPR